MKIAPIEEIRDFIMEMGGDDAYKCYQCGKCMSVCPWAQVQGVDLPVYRVPQSAKLGIPVSSEDKNALAKEVDEVFRCVGCEACASECPHGVRIPDILRAVRRILVDYGSYPEVLKPIVSTMRSVGNPLGQPREKRGDWAKDMQIAAYEEGIEFLYSPCCLPAYDPRSQSIARATAMILKKGNVSFGILGEREGCCGEAMRRAGVEKLFEELAISNIAAMKGAGVRKVITTSPHCYDTFKKDYQELGAEFEVWHATQIFWDLLREEKITPTTSIKKKVVYHDPCTLGRKNEIYDEPRDVLKSIPGLELVEIENFSREFALCCGGGSGGLWLDWPKEERMANVRVEQAASTGAQILAVACPYCLHMFEDSVKVLKLDMEVKDVSELLAESLTS